MNQQSILIIDDMPENLSVLDLLLRSAGYKVRVADSGEIALASLQKLTVDLILLDIRMPNMDGYEVCEALKKNPTTQNIPVIFLSALNEPSDKVKAFEMGGIDYISKPFSDLEVLARVKTHLQLSNLQQHLETEVEKRTEALCEANAGLEKALAAKKEFLALMGHEFRTPLNAILGVTEFLKDELQASQLRYVEMLEDSGWRLLNLVKNILQLTQHGTPDLASQQKPSQVLDAKRLCEESLYSISMLAKEKQILVRLQADENLPLLILPATHSRLAQVVGNLLDNAVKFTPEQGEIGIRVSYLSDIGRLLIDVWDTGTSIPESQHERIFEPFVQLAPLLSRRNEGPGLGLTLARNLVELHGGKIELITYTKEGNLFRIYMPAQAISESELAINKNTLSEHSLSSETSASQLVGEQRDILKKMLQNGAISEMIFYLRNLTQTPDCPKEAHELLALAESFEVQAISQRLI